MPYDNYIVLYEGNDSENVVPIGKTISRDICGKGVRKVAMRVRAMDKDTLNDGMDAVFPLPTALLHSLSGPPCFYR